MIRLLLRALIFLASAALGLLVAMWVLPGFHLSLQGILIAIVVFAIAQSVLSPFFMKMAARHARAFLGGVGLVSTFVALLVASFLPGGISMDGWVTWLLATLIVWLVTALATFLLPMLFLKKGVQNARERRDD